MFPYRGLLAIIIIGLGVLVVNTGVTRIPTPASLSSIVQESSFTLPSMSSNISSLTVSDLYHALENTPDILVIDVRASAEWQEAHIDHPQVQLIPLAQVIQDPSRIDTSKEVYLLCQSGNRSSIAQMVLKARGIDTINVEGGMTAWESAGYPVVSSD